MEKGCIYIPKKGAETFIKLSKAFGRNRAIDVYGKITGSDFQRVFGDSISFDKDGVPTFESIMQLKEVRDFIGQTSMLANLNRQQPHMDDTLANVSLLTKRAEEFNNDNKDYIAIVDYDSKGKLTLDIQPRTKETIAMAANQQAIQKINERASEILSPLGISIDMLDEYQTSVGRVGLTEFTKSKEVADGFGVLMAVANNMEGSNAISEEFAHFIIGVMREKPLVERSINYLKDEAHAKEILGDEFDNVYEYYNGNMDLVAEEAAGHVFKQALLDRINKTDKIKVSLLQRMANFIINLFKGFNPAYYQNNIDRIYKDYSKLADNVLSGKVTIKKSDIQKARREASFNALSERVKVQIKTLKDITERAYKSAALQDNLDDLDKGDLTQKSAARKFAEQVKDAITRHVGEEETMAAIADFLTLAQDNINELFFKVSNLEGKSAKDKFTILRNALTAIQSYQKTIDELEAITSEEYMSDEAISGQQFIVGDVTNSLEEFEADDDEMPIDTTGKSVNEVANIIQQESEKWQLSDDETYYQNTKTGLKSTRVTKVIEADKEGKSFDPNNPWVTPSTNIGTGIDELTRDFLGGKITKESDGTYTINGKQLDEVYPNASNKALNKFVKQLEEMRDNLTSRGITLISRDIIANGTIDTIDGTGKVHTVNVAGTLDLLGYDADGNWYIYDMKTHRGIIDSKKEKKWRRQLSLYKQFLENKYGIKVKEMGIIPIKVEYPTPNGYGSGTTNYTVSTEASAPEYNGKRNNQLIADGSEFKDANPQLEEIKPIKEIDLDIQYRKLAKDPTNGMGGGRDLLVKAVTNTRKLYGKFCREFSEKAIPEFLEFLKPFVGENIRIADENRPGKFKTVSIRSILESSKNDVTLMQRWFTSMADNPDALLQIFDKVVKRQKDEHRIRTIEKAQEILALGMQYEKLGITSYDWMFEKDKKNYINKEYDLSAYNKAKEAKLKELDAQYGEHPAIGSTEWKEKNKARKEWIKENTEVKKTRTGGVTYIPLRSKYPSNYDSLSDTQKEFYDKWMTLKSELDNLIGSHHTHLTNTIKIRKSGIERLKGAMSGEAISNFIESTKAKMMRSFDDDITYKDAKGIRGFDDREVMKLPLYYVYGGKGNQDDLSTDVIGTLIAYADMAYNYDAMNQVVNPLEIGRELVLTNRKINATKGNKHLFETFRYAGRTIRNPIYEDTKASNFRAALDDFFESKIYGRYLKDAGEIAGIDVNKGAGILLKLGSTVQLGFNLLANLANAGTGLAMQNIEAAAGEFFNARELASADAEFAKEMPAYLGDIGQRATKSKLALFDQMFDVRQNFKSKIKKVNFLNKTILTRIFGPGIQYIGQDAGDHWLYNRTAIAMAKRHKLKDANGNDISLWDALEVVPIDKNNPDAGNKLVLKEGVTNKDGSKFSIKDISTISGQMRYVNQHLFGIYNDEDSIAARRMIWGRFLMQYRDWIPAQFRYRFGARTSNLEKGSEVEGYYRTTGRFAKQIYDELKHGEKTIGQVWDSLDDYERANVKRAVAEVIQLIVITAIASLLGGADKDRPWALRVISYWATREKTELGALVPFIQMPNEMIKIAKSPFAATNVIDDITGLTGLLWPPNYFDTIESGDYKDHSTAYKDFMKSPLTLWYRTIKRMTEPEKSEKFFNQ